VGVRIHNLGKLLSAILVALRFASRFNAPLTSNNFNRQSHISSVEAGLRNGSNMASVVASLPNKPNDAISAFCSGNGVNNTSISRTSPDT
jgi:hypothetical protein